MLSALLALCVALLALPAYAARSSSVNSELRAEAIVPLRSHSLFSPYVDSSLQNKFWDFGGQAIIDTNRYVRLTQDRPGEKGYLWSRLPIEVQDFEITAEFQVGGQSNSNMGDGFAMWLTTTRDQSGPVLGNQNYFKGLGILFDTFPNTPHRTFFPRISIVHNDGTMKYNVEEDGENQDLASCSAQLRKTPVETRLRFTYVKDVYMELSLQNQVWNKWTSCFRLPPVDIEPSYLGFSASTGGATDYHDIVSVWTNSLVYKSRTPAQLEAERQEMLGEESAKKKKNWWVNDKATPAPKPRTSSRGPSIITRTFFGAVHLVKWLVLFAAVGAAGFFGYRYYQSTYMRRHTRRTMA